MKSLKLSLLASLLAAGALAHAGGTGGLGHPGVGGGGGGGGGGTGTGVGVGIAAARAAAAASNRTEIGIATNVGLATTIGATTNNAAGGLGGAGGNGFGGAGGVATSAGGAGGSIDSGAVQVNAGNTTYKAASAPAFAPGGSGPVRSCRLFIGLGGTTTSGSLSGGIPIGNDQLCLVDSSHEMMNRMNSIQPGTFTRDDYLRPVCKAEGMSETAACKALEGRETAAAPRAQSLSGLGYGPN